MDLEKPYGRWFTTIMRKTDEYFDDTLGEMGLDSNRAGIMIYLYQGWEGSTQDEIAFRFNKDKSLISRTLKSLEKAGYIVRKQDEEDKRYHRIYLSEKGKSMKKTLKTREREWHERLMTGIPEEAIRVFVDSLEKIYDNALRYDKEESK